jgi:hypothetical protein
MKNIMKTTISFALLLFSVPALTQDKALENNAAGPVITAVGKPAGNKTEIKINKDVSSLRSSDGVVELIIPEGAVPKKTVISIQPITNLMPNGNGKAYRFEPSGVQFKKPIQLIFHYDEEEIKDSMQLLMGIAMQNDKGQWLSLKNFELDVVAKTISGNITHFSDWSNFTAIKLYPPYARVKVNKELDLTIDLVANEEELAPLDNDPMLAPLRRRNISWTSSWRANEILNGNNVVGTITPHSKVKATYKAPAKVPDRNPVAVTADLRGLNYTTKVRGQAITFTDLKLVSNLLIYDNAYEVTIVSEVQDPSGVCMGATTYKDTGSFVVSLNGSDARLIERVNRNTSAFLNYSGGRCWGYTILKTGTGNIHIAGTPVIKITPPSAPGKGAWIEISFRRVPAVFPTFQVTCKCDDAPDGPITTTNAKGIVMMARFLAAQPEYIKFEAKEGEQVIIEQGNPGGLLYTKFTVKQLREE